MVKHRRVSSIADLSFFFAERLWTQAYLPDFLEPAYTHIQVHKPQSTLPSPEYSPRYTPRSDLELSRWATREVRESH
jgi:hypothetical protein